MADLSKKILTRNGIYGPQDFIDFDCLDGATFDQVAGNLNLFGHWENADQHLWIPYYDYLATALDCKAPTFSLEWTPSSHSAVAHVLESGGSAILDSVRNLFDDGQLTFGGAWFLQTGRRAGCAIYVPGSDAGAHAGSDEASQNGGNSKQPRRLAG